jgi:gas vesicle protein
LRHGLIIGAAIAMLYTPWPGAILREKLAALGREVVDLVEAMRAGATEPA